MKRFVFINKVIKDSQGNPVYGQILETEILSRKVTSKIYSIKELKELQEKAKAGGEFVIDFSFDNGFLKCANVPSITLSDEELKLVNKQESVNKPILTSIYDLFDILVNSQALLVGDRIIEDDINMVDAGMTKFLPIYSQSTMTVYLSLRVDEQWKCKKLIYAEKGTLHTGNFYFAIPNDSAQLLTNYAVEYLKNQKYNDTDYAIYAYKGGMLTLAYNMDDIQIFGSIINRYVFMSELYKQILRMCSNLSILLTEAAYGEIPKPEETVTKDNISRYTNDYVKFKLNYKPPTKGDISALILDALQNVMPHVEDGSMDKEGLFGYISSLNLTTIKRLMYITICKILINGGREPLDRLEFIIKEETNYKLLKYKVDTILYMLRVNLFTVPVRLEDGNYQILMGGDAPYTSTLERRRE